MTNTHKTSSTGPIRVCFIALRAYPLFNQKAKGTFGGAEVDLYLLACELAKDENFNVSFMVGDYGQDQVEKRQNINLLKSLDVKKNIFLGSARIWRALRRADAMIYMSKGYSLGTVLYAFFCRAYNRKFIYRTANSRQCNGAYLKEHPLRGRTFTWTMHTAEKILAQNRSDAENLAGITNISAEVIPNGHPLEPLPQTTRDTILWVGRSATVKRPDLFLKLVQQSPGQQFTFVCQRSTGGERYDDLVQQAKKIKNMHFISRVPFRDIGDYFRRARVLVNTSDSEGFPNAFIQACKCSTPILSLNVNPDGFLDEYNCGIGCDGDWDRFVDSLKEMLSEPRYTELGRNARKYVEENHDIIKIVEQYKNCFMQIAQNKNKEDNKNAKN